VATSNAPIWIEIREDKAAGVVNAWLASHPDIAQERVLLGTLNARVAQVDRETFDQWVGVLGRHVERLCREILAQVAPGAKVVGSKIIPR